MAKLLVICGPTASGKTALAVALAKRTGGEVVSADSMQIYRRMDIGTAKPTAEEMDGVPHHMLDVADPGEDYSVARYVEEASACVEDILARGKLPIVAGGTGMYIDNLLAGRTFAALRASGGRYFRTGRQRRASRPSTGSWSRWTPSGRPGSTWPTRSGSSGRWRCGTRRARPSPSTTAAPPPCRPGMRRRASA